MTKATLPRPDFNIQRDIPLAGIIHDAHASSQKLLFYAQVSLEARV